jgi:hypothetical protein
MASGSIAVCKEVLGSFPSPIIPVFPARLLYLRICMNSPLNNFIPTRYLAQYREGSIYTAIFQAEPRLTLCRISL